MRLNTSQLVATAATLTLLASASASASSSSAQHVDQHPALGRRHEAPSHMRRARLSATRARRGPPTATLDYSGQTQTSIAAQARTDPVGAARAADSMPGVFNDTAADQSIYQYTTVPGDSESNQNPYQNQWPWFNTTWFAPNANAVPGPNADDSSLLGWTALPQLDGFVLNRTTTVVPGATQPYYITANYDASKIKRGVIVMPGKPRDAWKYTNLVRNALSVTAANIPEWGVTNDSVLIIGPAWLSQLEQQYGATLPSDLVFHGSQWQSGGVSHAPNLTHSVSTYTVIDYFADWLFDRARFPALTSVAVVGHSMGGQAVMRYALAKKAKAYDDNMHFFIGNPGSWAWLTADRPIANASCPTPDEWGYGLGGNQSKITKYFRDDIMADKNAVISRYQSRHVHYALGLLDLGPGDTHCEATMQGGNHLDRGTQFIQMLGALPGGFPKLHTAHFVPNTSHQDYAMLSFNTSLQYIFKEGLDARQPDLTTLVNPGDKPKTSPTPKAKAFATPKHTIMAYSLLGGSVGAVVLAFTLIPFLFPVNTDRAAQEAWEVDTKQRLMSG